MDKKTALQKRKARAKEWKQFREENLLTQEEFAGLLEVHRRTVQNVEFGKSDPYVSTLRKFEAVKAKYAKGKSNGRKGTEFAALGR